MITKPSRFKDRVPSHTHAFAKLEIRIFWCPLPWGSECSGNYQPRGNGKTARESARQIPAGSRSGSADPTAPEQVWQAPGLRELRLAESEQILPPVGNRKPASDRTHWIEPAPCSSRRRSCPGGERGDRQSSVSADFHPVTGIANRQEDRRIRLQNRVVSTTARRQHTHFRKM